MRINGYSRQSATLTRPKKIDFDLYDYEPIHHRISVLIEEYMYTHMLSMDEMAYMLGICTETLERRLNGGVDYRGLEILKLSKLTGLEFNELLTSKNPA